MRLFLCRLVRKNSYVAALLFAQALHAQTAADTARDLAQIDRALVSISKQLEDVWPGFRYDQVGLLYMIPGVGKVAARWPGATVLQNPSKGAVLGLAIHEAFHAYQVTQRAANRRFGKQENALLTASYPVFDVEAETLFAVEAGLLAKALVAASRQEQRRLGAQFVAVRLLRQSRLPAGVVEYEKQAELNEGLAQYALLRGLRVVERAYPEQRGVYANELRNEATELANTFASARSVRRRFYATGAYQGLLLDALVGAQWKDRIATGDVWLQDAVREAVGHVEVSAATRAEIERLRPRGAAAVASLQATRIALRDSIANQPGLRLIIEPTGLTRSFEWCNMDPQNLVQTGAGQSLHLRMLRLCADGAEVADFSQPVIEDAFSGTYRTVVAPASVRLSSGGQATELPPVGTASMIEQFVLEAPTLRVVAARALVVRGAQQLLVVPLR